MFVLVVNSPKVTNRRSDFNAHIKELFRRGSADKDKDTKSLGPSDMNIYADVKLDIDDDDDSSDKSDGKEKVKGKNSHYVKVKVGDGKKLSRGVFVDMLIIRMSQKRCCFVF